jgi:amino-acid N-acetyltransferase
MFPPSRNSSSLSSRSASCSAKNVSCSTRPSRSSESRRSLTVAEDWLGHGVGKAILTTLEADARELGLRRLFCLTFEVPFFTRNGFLEIGDEIIDPVVYSEMVRSTDEGVAEFLDLARVKPNTLGNSRMLKLL